MKREPANLCYSDMIRLTATRIDVYGRFRFTIERGDDAPVVTSEALKAAKILHRLGVPNPVQLVDHARHWGSVEIVEGDPAATALEKGAEGKAG